MRLEEGCFARACSRVVKVFRRGIFQYFWMDLPVDVAVAVSHRQLVMQLRFLL